MLFLLCPEPTCRRAWVAPVASACHGRPVEINPFSGERRTWWQARITPARVAEIAALAHYAGNREHRRALLKGIRAKGNTSVRVRAEA